MSDILSIQELLDAHNNLENHDRTCQKKCLTQLLESLDKPTPLEPGQVIKF